MSLKSQGEIVDDVNALRQILPELVEYLMFEAAIDFKPAKKIMYRLKRAASGSVMTADFSRQPDWLLALVKERKNRPVARWQKTVEIKDVLDLENNSLEQIYLQIVLRFEAEHVVIPESFHDRARQAVSLDDVDVFDIALEKLYEWADAKRIWLGV